MTIRTCTATTLFAAAALVMACGGNTDAAPADTAAPQAATTPGDPATPDAGGKVILVDMITDDQGVNKYEPRVVTANPGDVIRYTLKVGVHNVNFLPDSNAVKTGLPVASPMLQLPGQTFDQKVTLALGSYHFQCDPHALLGMTGQLKVEAR